MKEDTLLDMVNHMTEKTGLIHQMPFTCDRNGFAATLEKVRLYLYKLRKKKSELYVVDILRYSSV